MSKRISLGEAISFKNGKTPPARSNILKYPVFGANGIIGHSSEINSNGPCIVIGRVGAYCGSLHYSSTPCWVTDNAIIAEPKNQNESRYWFYALKTLDLHNRSQGSGQPLINQEILRSITFGPCTPREMSTISTILGALDDKIAANKTTIRKTSELSEALTNSVLRDVGETNVGSVASVITRGAAPKYAEIGFTVLNQKCIRNGRVDTSHGRISSKLPKNQEKILTSEDILINSTGQGTLGRVARWTRRDQEASVDSHVTIVRIDPNKADPTFVGTCLLSKEKAIEALAEGSTGQTELRKESIAALPLRLPSLGIQRQVGTDLRELAILADALEDESRTLAATRDELLPLLMSGKITVRDAEKRVEKEV